MSPQHFNEKLNEIFATEPRVKALVSSCGFNSFSNYYGGNLTGSSSRNYMPKIAEEFGKDPVRMPFDFTELLAALAPRPAFINAPLRDDNFEVSGMRDCIAAALPVYQQIFRSAIAWWFTIRTPATTFPPTCAARVTSFWSNGCGKTLKSSGEFP